MGRKGAGPAAAPAVETTPAAPPQSSGTEGVHVDEGGKPGSRPGPRAAQPTTTNVPTGRTDVAAPLAGPSAKDLNERQWESKNSRLRDAVIAQAAKEKAPSGAPVFGARLTEDDVPDDDGGDRVGPKPVAEEPAEPKKADAAKSTDAELAKIAEKERENRELRRELKRAAEAPKGLRIEKLKELAKANPVGVAEALGIDVAELNLRIIKGEKGEPVKFEEDAPKKSEPTQAEKELADARAELAATRMREAKRNVSETVATLVKDTKVDGKLRWHNVALIGDEARDAATDTALAFARGEVDESGKKLDRPRKMKAFSNEDAQAVLEHFLDVEDGKWEARAKKLGAASQRPDPRRPSAPATRQRYKARPGLDTNDPRNRPTAYDINEQLRERFFGVRR